MTLSLRGRPQAQTALIKLARQQPELRPDRLLVYHADGSSSSGEPWVKEVETLEIVA
jgi:hypothetical protein